MGGLIDTNTGLGDGPGLAQEPGLSYSPGLSNNVVPAFEMITQTDIPMVTESGEIMITEG